MRGLRILLILVVILGVLFVVADRLALHFAEGEAADKLKTTQNLSATPDVDIKGFPFLTQVANRKLNDVTVDISQYEAATGDDKGTTVRIDDLEAKLKGLRFSGSSFSSATADTATGSARITYAELLKAAKSESTQVVPGFDVRVASLSDGGDGRIKVTLEATLLGRTLPRVSVLSAVSVHGDTVRVRAVKLPTFDGVTFGEDSIRSVVDFEQRIEQLPGGIQLDKVTAAKDGVDISVKGANVNLAE
ncbi:DUF2993 domain-containing protein [Streptomyces sp. NPDC090306]|uniref:LmeA family phospholipid-binding protein n=1 Tax=unclassified Streptomyces TaxID=2593676 RepID=UPI0036E16435